MILTEVVLLVASMVLMVSVNEDEISTLEPSEFVTFKVCGSLKVNVSVLPDAFVNNRFLSTPFRMVMVLAVG